MKWLSRGLLILVLIVAATVVLVPSFQSNSASSTAGVSAGQGSQSATSSSSRSARNSATADELTETSFSSTRDDSTSSYVIEFHDNQVCYLTQAENGNIAGVSKGTYAIKNGALTIQDIPAIKSATYDGEDTMTIDMASGTWTFNRVSALNEERLLDSMAEKLGPAS